MSDEMEEAYRKDSVAERAFRDAAREIENVVNEHIARLGTTDVQKLRDAHVALKARADHIVAVWD